MPLRRPVRRRRRPGLLLRYLLLWHARKAVIVAHRKPRTGEWRSAASAAPKGRHRGRSLVIAWQRIPSFEAATPRRWKRSRGASRRKWLPLLLLVRLIGGWRWPSLPRFFTESAAVVKVIYEIAGDCRCVPTV